MTLKNTIWSRSDELKDVLNIYQGDIISVPSVLNSITKANNFSLETCLLQFCKDNKVSYTNDDVEGIQDLIRHKVFL